MGLQVKWSKWALRQRQDLLGFVLWFGLEILRVDLLVFGLGFQGSFGIFLFVAVTDGGRVNSRIPLR